MTGESTSLPSLVSMRAEWSHFFGFIKRPSLPDNQASDLHKGARALSHILALDLMAMGMLLAIAGAVMASGIEIPETALASTEITPGIIFAVILVAPVIEEILFRSWLSGRPRYLIAFPILLVAGLTAVMLAANNTGENAEVSLSFAIIVGALLSLIMFGVLWRRPPMRWFRTLFPAMFWLSTIVFACIHLANFSEGKWMTLLPLVLPQFILGALLGYLRVNYGLLTAIALHMIHNGLIITVVLAASKAVGAT